MKQGKSANFSVTDDAGRAKDYRPPGQIGDYPVDLFDLIAYQEKPVTINAAYRTVTSR